MQAAEANITAAETQISDVLPAQRESAQRQLEQAQVALDKTVVYAGVDGQVAQFFLAAGRLRESHPATGGRADPL